MLVVHITADTEAERDDADALAATIKASIMKRKPKNPKRSSAFIRVMVWDKSRVPTLGALNDSRVHGVEAAVYVMVRRTEP